jgi:predicted nucleic acid-binding protein
VVAALQGAYEILVSDRLIVEYRDVFGRERIVQLHRNRSGAAALLLNQIQETGTIVVPEFSPFDAPDPRHQHLWDLLATVPDAILVTGDRRLLQSSDYAGRVLSPREFVDRYLDAGS